ncbi:MAG TPA: hypothetical protein VK034_20280, partial [Enhygromyxa sp.]|nr:hypothetical protein [Enhygromyxa sp.]
IVLDGARFECNGFFEGEGEDVWTCSKGVEAHSRIKWEMPTFVIYRSRDDVDHLDAIHVKIWREEVLIFDNDVDIWWQLANADTTFEPPCGCWAGIIQANIQNFEMLEEGS